MIALIAEKPSVAKDIARIIGATGRNDGYLSGNGYMVTWAFGHLIQLAMPEAYGVANFRRESLPILPSDFRLIPRQVKAEKGYKADPGVLKQLKVIKEVFDQCDRIILDPPAFAKHRDALRNALRGYTKLNAKAFEKIRPGGILFTFSCSQVVNKQDFRNAVFTAAAQSGRSVRILHQLTQPGDHPVNIYHPEGEYLKGLVLYVE